MAERAGGGAPQAAEPFGRALGRAFGCFVFRKTSMQISVRCVCDAWRYVRADVGLEAAAGSSLDPRYALPGAKLILDST